MLLGKENLNNLEMEIYLFNRAGISTSILENFQKLAVRSKWLLSPLVYHMTVTISIGNLRQNVLLPKIDVQPSHQRCDKCTGFWKKGLHYG